MNPTPTPAAGAKLALRDQLLTARGELGVAEIGVRAREVARLVCQAPEVRRAGTLALYVSVGREPGTGPLLDALERLGKRILLPVLRPDFDLDWAPYAGPDALAGARRGLLEPTTPRLGLEAIATADVVFTPGLAVDGTGMRLGQGGGCYDRALARVPAGTPVWVVLNACEVIAQVPHDPHDRRVTGVVTESSVTRFEHQ